jgi:hypothetical protein
MRRIKILNACCSELERWPPRHPAETALLLRASRRARDRTARLSSAPAPRPRIDAEPLR